MIKKQNHIKNVTPAAHRLTPWFIARIDSSEVRGWLLDSHRTNWFGLPITTQYKIRKLFDSFCWQVGFLLWRPNHSTGKTQYLSPMALSFKTKAASTNLQNCKIMFFIASVKRGSFLYASAHDSQAQLPLSLYGWTHIWLDTYMAGHIYGWTHIWLDTYMAGHIYGWTHIWLNTYMAGHIYGWTHIWLDKYMAGQIYGWTHIWLDTYMAGHIRCRSCRQERVHATVSFKITWRYSSQTNTSIWTQIKQSKWIACQKGNKIPSHQVRSSKKFQQTLLKTSSTSHVHQIWFPASTTIPWYGNIHSTLSLEKSKPNICNIMNASDECILWMHLMNASDECIWWMHLMNASDECIWWMLLMNAFDEYFRQTEPLCQATINMSLKKTELNILQETNQGLMLISTRKLCAEV